MVVPVLKNYDDNCAEVKRVVVKKEYRGRGISKNIMKLLEQYAKNKGFSYLILESGTQLVEAQSLYKTMGYNIISNYGQYIDMPESICMKKKL